LKVNHLATLIGISRSCENELTLSNKKYSAIVRVKYLQYFTVLEWSIFTVLEWSISRLWSILRF
jgi:hypothetical protein